MTHFAKSEEEESILSSEADYNDTLSRSYEQPQMVVFSASWCGYCKQLKPLWEQASSMNKVASWKTVDCDDRQNPLIKKLNVQGFPTIVKLSGGKVYKFKKERTLENLLSFSA